MTAVRPAVGLRPVIAGLIGMLMSACNPFTPTYTYRYRITVEVDTPQGLRSGSSVWETRAWEGSGIPDRGIRSRERGEAVAVDVPGGTLFALLRYPNLRYDYVSGLFPGHLKKHPQPGVVTSSDWQDTRRGIIKAKPAFELYPDEYPLMVRFRDLNTPASVEKVDPTNLAASFGPGVRLRRIRVAVVNERPEVGSIYQRLPWLEQWNGQLLPAGNLPVADQTFPSRVNDGDFVRSSR